MRTLLISLILAGIASAQVPSLINYQGRLTNADGEPLTGTKNFELKIFDAQTEGNLLYTEDVGAIQLGEGGVYSFQFGGKGTSNTQVTETVGNGNGEDLYQKVLSNTPVVEGSVSVSDGTYTWSQESGSSNEDDFSASFSTNLNRITVNYFAGAPDDNREIKVTYRYEAEGIVGALSSDSDHWLQLSIDGETQATRERVLAVPFALRAGVADTIGKPNSIKKMVLGPFGILPNTINKIERIKYIADLGKNGIRFDKAKFQIRRIPYSSQQLLKLLSNDDVNSIGEIFYESPIANADSENVRNIENGKQEVNQIVPDDLIFDHEKYVYYLLSFYQPNQQAENWGTRLPGHYFVVNQIYYK